MTNPRLSLRWFYPSTFDDNGHYPKVLQQEVLDHRGEVFWATIPTIYEGDEEAS